MLCGGRASDLRVSSSVTRLSTAVTISTMDPSSQDVEDTEASTPLHHLQDGESPGCQGAPAPSCWLLYSKPIMAIVVGTLLFGAGTALSLLYFTQVGHVPYLLGPLFLSVGLMFLVTGLVWIPVLKESGAQAAHQGQPW
ncbi:phosphoinositide-interacting protein-like isoform X1 [Perca fluviatilis]|nr:phosphoinositide-interacting protein-like isoform X1 [Perca fluviatilis]